MSNPQTQSLTPQGLANQLFDAAIAQHPTNPRDAALHVIKFMTEALIYAVSSTAAPGDEAARKALLKSVGETITNAPPLPAR